MDLVKMAHQQDALGAQERLGAMAREIPQPAAPLPGAAVNALAVALERTIGTLSDGQVTPELLALPRVQGAVDRLPAEHFQTLASLATFDDELVRSAGISPTRAAGSTEGVLDAVGRLLRLIEPQDQ